MGGKTLSAEFGVLTAHGVLTAAWTLVQGHVPAYVALAASEQKLSASQHHPRAKQRAPPAAAGRNAESPSSSEDEVIPAHYPGLQSSVGSQQHPLIRNTAAENWPRSQASLQDGPSSQQQQERQSSSVKQNSASSQQQHRALFSSKAASLAKLGGSSPMKGSSPERVKEPSVTSSRETPPVDTPMAYANQSPVTAKLRALPSLYLGSRGNACFGKADSSSAGRAEHDHCISMSPIRQEMTRHLPAGSHDFSPLNKHAPSYGEVLSHTTVNLP